MVQARAHARSDALTRVSLLFLATPPTHPPKITDVIFRNKKQNHIKYSPTAPAGAGPEGECEEYAPTRPEATIQYHMCECKLPVHNTARA